MHKLAQNYTNRGVDVWAVLASPFGAAYEVSRGRDISPVDRSDLSWYRQQFGVDYPILIDPRFRTVNRYLPGAYPAVYVIDRSGKIAYTHDGEQPYSLLSQQVDRVLAQRARS